MAKRKFNPKSNILGKYFNEIPFGLKEMSLKLPFGLPLYEQTIKTQYKFIILLTLINKRQETLDSFINLDKTSFGNIFLALSFDSYKSTIPLFRGISEYKRQIILNFLFNLSDIQKKNDFMNPLINKNSSDKEIRKEFRENLLDILTKKDKDLKSYELGFLLSNDHKKIFDKRKQNIPHIQGKLGNISFETLRMNDTRALFLDEFSDCCQGLNKAGHSCMVSGINNENEGFLVFERRGVIFAQGWIRKIENDLLIDSIEFKGDFNTSLIDSFQKAVKNFSSHFENIYLGISPNRNEITKAFNDKTVFHLLNKNNSVKHIFDYVNSFPEIYSDARSKIIKLN